MPQERVISFHPRTILVALAIVLTVLGLLEIIWLARQVLTWILIALFLALALNPLVERLQQLGIRRRALATGTAYILVLGVIAGLAATVVPSIVGEVRDFVDAVPDYIEDLTAGRGPLGFLEREYEIVERARDAVSNLQLGRVLGASGIAVEVTRGVITAVVATISIAVLTFFMLLEGPGWVERLIGLLPEESRPRWRRVLRDIYRTVGGFVTGALTIAFIAGALTTVLLLSLGVTFAFALGLLVLLLDLIPLAGATIAAALVSTVAFIDSGVGVGIAVLVFFIVYQQVENHFLYPLIYSRTLQLSPLVILIAVLVGASLAGILGALAAIPVAGTLQVIFIDWLKNRRGSGPPRLAEPI